MDVAPGRVALLTPTSGATAPAGTSEGRQRVQAVAFWDRQLAKISKAFDVSISTKRR